MSDARPMPVVLLEWRSFRKSSLRGFAKVELGALRMNELTVHASSGKKWVGMPARPVLGNDGQPQRDQRGKVRYASLIEWKTRGAADRFSASVIAAIEEKHPGATDEGE